MPSPFPGMNPYLEHEDAWHNFQKQFGPAVVAALVPQMGSKYSVKVNQRTYVHEPSCHQRQHWRMAVDEESLSFVEIRDRRNRRLVTVINLLSPSNKNPGPDRDQYEAKRAEILASQTHLVEIDFLRGGPRMPYEEEVVPCDYCVMVSRYAQRPRADFWPLSLRDPLPQIPIPLADDDPEAKLDLQGILHRLY